MNMFKKNGGFTLVELTVVIAILAILAGVAIPVYSGYITKAQDAAANTKLDALQTAVQAANATNVNPVAEIEVDSTSVTVTVEAGAEAQEAFIENFPLFYDNENSAVTYASGAYSFSLDADILEGSSFETATWTEDGWN